MTLNADDRQWPEGAPGRMGPTELCFCPTCESTVPVRWPHTCFDAALARRAEGRE